MSEDKGHRKKNAEGRPIKDNSTSYEQMHPWTFAVKPLNITYLLLGVVITVLLSNGYQCSIVFSLQSNRDFPLDLTEKTRYS